MKPGTLSRPRDDGIELVDVTEIARRLNVKPGTVHKWRLRGIFPDPFQELTIGPIWFWRTVRSWAESSGRYQEAGELGIEIDSEA